MMNNLSKRNHIFFFQCILKMLTIQGSTPGTFERFGNINKFSFLFFSFFFFFAWLSFPDTHSSFLMLSSEKVSLLTLRHF